MAPRHRSKKNRHLEGTNIKKFTKKSKNYFYYVMPDGSLQALAHGDEAASMEAAIILNQHLRPSGKIVENILAAPVKTQSKNPLFIDVVNEFESEWLLKQKYSERSLKERKIKLNVYRRTFENVLVGDLDTFAIATFLKALSTESARQHRSLLDQIFRYAASNGYQTTRPMVDIEKRKQEKRKRARHTWEGYKAIRDASSPWLQRAIDIALYSLQRRGDLCAINAKEQIDLSKKTITIRQQKTENYGKPVLIDIAMGGELYDAVLASIKSDVHCPYLIHHRPARITKQSREAKPHPFAVLPEYLTREYSKVRDSIGVYDHLPKLQRPGFHSIRALGVWIYTKAGYSDEYIMALDGHASKVMKDRYAEGHEKPEPVKVSANLSLANMDFNKINWETDLSPRLQKLIESED